MLDELNSRLRGLNSGRRASTWQHQGSTGSFDSGHGGSMSYDPSQSHGMSISSGPSSYQGHPSGMSSSRAYRQQSVSTQQSPGVADAVAAGQISPQHYPFPDQRSFQAQYANALQGQQQYQEQYQDQRGDMQPHYTNGQHTQQHFPPFDKPSFNFNEAVPVPSPHPFTSYQGNSQAYALNRPNHPTQQFASWSGYGGPGGAPDTLDEENAVPPNSNPWNIDAK